MYKKIAIGCLLFYAYSFGNDFEAYAKTFNREYSSYEKSLNKSFQAYQKAYDDAFKKYAKELGVVWGEETKISNNKRYVEYSKDKKKREIIDYEKGEVLLEVIIDSRKKIKRVDFQKQLDKLLSQSVAQAFFKDPINVMTNAFLKKQKITKGNIHNKSPLVGGLIAKKMTQPIKTKTIQVGQSQKKVAYVKIPMIPNHLKKKGIKI